MLKQKQLDGWNNNKKKSLSEVKRRIRKILSSIEESDCIPNWCTVNGSHEFSFTLKSKEGCVKGFVTIRI